MAKKTVTCCICGEQVSKRQTLAVGPGQRACRKHDNTQEKSHELLIEEKKKNQVLTSHFQKQKNQWTTKSQLTSLPKVPTCMICGTPGLRQNEWYSRLLIEYAKFEEIHGHPTNPFDLEESKKAAGVLAGVPCLWYVAWKGENTKAELAYNTYQFAKMFGTLLACSGCCESKGLITMTQQQTEKLTFEQLTYWAVIAEMTQPTIKDIAIKELSQNN